MPITCFLNMTCLLAVWYETFVFYRNNIKHVFKLALEVLVRLGFVQSQASALFAVFMLNEANWLPAVALYIYQKETREALAWIFSSKSWQKNKHICQNVDVSGYVICAQPWSLTWPLLYKISAGVKVGEALNLAIKPAPDWGMVAWGWREPGGQPCAEPPLPAARKPS